MNHRRWWLAVALICCLAPSAFADLGPRLGSGSGQGPDHHRGCNPHSRNCQQVPEGGSTAIYVLGAGLICVGAIILRSRMAKSTQS
jgi:hypothetical protein